MTKQALAIVYNESLQKVFVVHEYGLLDITPFYKDLDVRPSAKGVHCEITGELEANYIPDDPE